VCNGDGRFSIDGRVALAVRRARRVATASGQVVDTTDRAVGRAGRVDTPVRRVRVDRCIRHAPDLRRVVPGGGLDLVEPAARVDGQALARVRVDRVARAVLVPVRVDRVARQALRRWARHRGRRGRAAPRVVGVSSIPRVKKAR
jgi:hypothetical protein